MKKKILISAANGVIMKSLISFLSKDFKIIGIDTNNIGDANKYCYRFYKSPNPKNSTFINFIKKRLKQVSWAFFFVDEEIKKIILNKKKLGINFKKIILSPKKTIDLCLNKRKFMFFFKKIKINVPFPNHKYPMIAKPVNGRGSRNIYIIKNKSDLKYFIKKKNYIIQKYIRGKEFTVDCLFDKKGKIIFDLARERIVTRGVSVIGKIVKHNRISSYIKHIASKLIFCGPINFQFIEDYDKKLWLIEINPRLAGSVEFSIRSGFKIIHQAIKIFSNDQIKQKYKIQYNKIYKRYFQISNN